MTIEVPRGAVIKEVIVPGRTWRCEICGRVIPIGSKAIKIGKKVYCEQCFQKEISKPVKGEQAGMLGVPGKYVEQRRPWTPGQVEIESYGKYKEAMGVEAKTVVDYDRQYTLTQLREMCKEKGLSASGDKKTLARRLIGG